MHEQLCLFANIERAEEFIGAVNELKELAHETRGYLRILCAPLYNKALSKALPLKEERVVYVLSDGDTSYREVAKAAGVPKSKVERWWPEWIERGIGEAIPVQRGGQRCKAKYTLLELAIAVLEGQVDID